ncbi:MlaE family ABC transporter permease [Helicobacter turcicus]|uniref:ABC transporter permease n=1 Tax=Helicobacter turcicus TaxID=2867412 RepID=A0ABS7JMA1_9HELI|nr:ABC transporter permease [Helicobacter turcicus]MBX7490524.1 ABC transporter permease [Helicobacter turcicus]MBX7545383.1 ABC transporter permease [Helicobacter turcicus]
MLARVEFEPAHRIITLFGIWDRSVPKSTLNTLESLLNTLSKTSKTQNLRIQKDSSFDLDFCGGAVLLNWLEALNTHCILENTLLNYPKSAEIFSILQSKTTFDKKEFRINVIQVHKDTLEILKAWGNRIVISLSFLGEIVYLFYCSVLNPRDFRIRALFFQIQEAVIKAVPIISLACFLIGIVIAYQGSLQLQQFGASALIVEMSAMLTLREMAPIIVAIIIAGRSASAFSAEIGMMRATQEIDAMRVMGFNPVTFLIFPRIFALLFALPLVVFIADMFGLLGGMLVSQLQLGISSEYFIESFLQNVEIYHFWVGMIKAPFFGIIIGLIGCYHGFATQKDTRSIGVHTTKSVVESIFLVIAFDALCSVLFTQIGW